jgi:CheY-like chemotaxis protein
LIGNAIKFTEKDTIAFGYTQPDPTQLQFYVKDSGIGVPNDKLELIFDRFRQVEDSNTRKYGGTGLGLTISRNLVKLLGGEIWVESVLDKGSTFYFTLPFKPIVASTPIQTPINTEHLHFDWNDKTILVAEDLDINYLFIEKALQKTNVNLVRAVNGEEAISKCKEDNNIDLVLMDIRMPVMNGYEATKEIKKFRKELPIIAQTAHALSEEKGKSLEAGCNDYIAKPIKLNILLPLLNQYLTKTNHK